MFYSKYVSTNAGACDSWEEIEGWQMLFSVEGTHVGVVRSLWETSYVRLVHQQHLRLLAVKDQSYSSEHYDQVALEAFAICFISSLCLDWHSDKENTKQIYELFLEFLQGKEVPFKMGRTNHITSRIHYDGLQAKISQDLRLSYETSAKIIAKFWAHEVT